MLKRLGSSTDRQPILRAHHRTIYTAGRPPWYDYQGKNYRNICSHLSEIYVFFKKWAILGLFYVYFCIFKQTLQFLQQITEKNVYPVYGAEIRTHNLWNMSLLP